jgi:WD40 repeat protein
VLCVEDSFQHEFRSNNITTRYELFGTSRQIHHEVYPLPRYKVSHFNNYLHMSANLRHLATCSADSTVRIWSTVNYEYTPEKTLTGHQRWVWDAAFSADSAYLVTGKSC